MYAYGSTCVWIAHTNLFGYVRILEHGFVHIYKYICKEKRHTYNFTGLKCSTRESHILKEFNFSRENIVRLDVRRNIPKELRFYVFFSLPADCR